MAGVGQCVRALRCCSACLLVAAYRPDEREAPQCDTRVQAQLTGEFHASLGARCSLRGPPGDRLGPPDAVQEYGEHADGAGSLGSVDATLIEGSCDVELSEVERRATSPEQLGGVLYGVCALDDLAQECDAISGIPVQRAREPDQQRRHETVVGGGALG